METVIVLPTQLFEKTDLIGKNTQVYIYEHPLYFTKYDYHKLKLILHRGSMKYYEDYLRKNYKCKVKYLEFKEDIKKVFSKHKGKSIDMFDPVDHDIEKEFNALAKKYKVDLGYHDTPYFTLTRDDIEDYLDQAGKKPYFQTSFYIWQRKRLNILLNSKGKPEGGKWTYDKENRDPFPKNFKTDPNFRTNNSKYVKKATKYVNKHFKDNFGDDDYYLPIDHEGAKSHLTRFLGSRLNCFGPYQDAVDKDIIFGCHSVLSPLINVGLLTPDYVVERILDYYDKNKKKVKLASVEAIIRQIIGWRCFMGMLYIKEHKKLTSSNFLNQRRKLGDEWYTGNTGIEPIDDIIHKVQKYGYAHHIERLMYLGNFMLLSNIKPDDAYTWFMSFIDAYPWVMETNVYGMSQFSAGDILSTRPYFSSSNYVDNMSSYHRKKDNDYKKIELKGEEYEWFEVWDALYYNFINDNKTYLKKNYATARSVSHWNKKSASEKKELLNIAKEYLKKY